jgi:S1-C subfamily serine protease
MKRMRQIRMVLQAVGSAALLVVAAYLFVALGGRDLLVRPAALPPPETAVKIAPAGGRPDSFADIADAVRPAVVNIATRQATRPGLRGIDPFREFLERYFGQSLPPEESGAPSASSRR